MSVFVSSTATDIQPLFVLYLDSFFFIELHNQEIPVANIPQSTPTEYPYKCDYMYSAYKYSAHIHVEIKVTCV